MGWCSWNSPFKCFWVGAAGGTQVIQEALSSLETEVIVLIAGVSVILLLVLWYLLSVPKVYLVDFVVMHPKKENVVTHEYFMVRAGRVAAR